jgi:hypothetical protein
MVSMVLFIAISAKMVPLGLEPRTSRVLGERDNHYTMEPRYKKKQKLKNKKINQICVGIAVFIYLFDC